MKLIAEVLSGIKVKFDIMDPGGSIAQWLACLIPDPAVTCLNPSIPEIFSEEICFDIAEVIQWRWSEESGQRLENVDQTYLVLDSGKPELQKVKF